MANYHKTSVFALHTTDKLLFSGSRDHYINVFSLDTLDLHQKLSPPHYDGVNAFCQVGPSLVISASRDKTMKLWQIRDQDVSQDRILNAAHDDWINALCRHKSSLYSGCRDGTIANWNIENFTQTASFAGHGSSVNAIVSSGAYLFSASNDKTIKVWRESDM